MMWFSKLRDKLQDDIIKLKTSKRVAYLLCLFSFYPMTKILAYIVAVRIYDTPYGTDQTPYGSICYDIYFCFNDVGSIPALAQPLRY